MGLIIILLRTEVMPPAASVAVSPLFVEFVQFKQPSTTSVVPVTKPSPAPRKSQAAPALKAIATSENASDHVVEREAVMSAPLVSEDVTPVELPPMAVEAAAPSPTHAQPASPIDVPPAPQLISKVEYLQPPRPVYPTLSRRLHEQGEVVVRVLITPQGRSAEVTVERTSGSARLDQAAIEAVYAAVFKPRLENGVAVPAYAFIPIRFEL